MKRRNQDQLTISSASSVDLSSQNSTPRSLIKSADVFNFYDMGEHIGSGFLGSVHYAFPKQKASEKSLVVKIMTVDEE
jgi:hypothetical protein